MIPTDKLLMQKRFEECERKFKKYSPSAYDAIDSYDDMSFEEKADFFDKVVIRVKGRLPKNNKYRKSYNQSLELTIKDGSIS